MAFAKYPHKGKPPPTPPKEGRKEGGILSPWGR